MLTLTESLEHVLFEDLLKTMNANAKQLSGKYVYAIGVYSVGTKISIRCLDSSRKAKELIGLEVVPDDEPKQRV